MKYLVAFILCFNFGLYSHPAAACEAVSGSKADGRSHWYCASASSTVVVFVHGLNSNGVDAWTYLGDGPDKRVFWPDLVKSDPLIAALGKGKEPPSILLASFHTGPGSRDFRIADAQKQIFDALFGPVDGQPPAIEKRTIILVGHSLGGVLLRDLLSQNSDQFLGKRLGLMLVASPSKGSNFANVAKFAQWAVDNTMVRELEQGSSYLDEVHARFAASIGEHGKLRFLVGRELYEHLGLLEASARCTSNTLSIFGVACAASQRFASYMEGGPVVPRDSAVMYWPETARLIPQSEHSSIARPTDTGHPSHQALRELISATHQAAVSACTPPQNLGLTFKIQSRGHRCLDPDAVASTPTFELFHLNVDDGAPLRPVLPLTYDPITQAYRLRISEPPFPCTNELFWGKLVPAVQTSRRATTEPCSTEICFRRSRNASAARFALFNCVAGDKCLIPESREGVADACGEGDRTAIMVQAEPAEARAPYWTSPSLETLEKMAPAVRPGYTEFHIVSEPLMHVSDVTSFGYEVFVNDNPVRFDGLAPFYERQSIEGGSRIHLTFPIENLGFRGGNAGDGYEDIKVEIKFFNGDTAIGTATLRRRYVAYRHGTVITEIDPETGETFSWRAIYRPATSGQNFEVMLEHGAVANWMKDRRAALDQLGKSHSGQPVIGVLRPGRVENKRIGMIVGLVQETGQVRSLHTKAEAEKICRWILEQPEFSGLQKKASYIFEFSNETFDDTQDRGRRVAYCADV